VECSKILILGFIKIKEEEKQYQLNIPLFLGLPYLITLIHRTSSLTAMKMTWEDGVLYLDLETDKM
jgi:hypothetical protein